MPRLQIEFNTGNLLKEKFVFIYALCGLIVLFLIEGFFFSNILHYNLMHSDVLTYWQQSIGWRTPFYDHPPLYALSIAFIRGITFNTINPVALMMAINLLTYAISIICVYKFSRNAGINQAFSIFATLLFGLWPFVGLTFTVMPIADSPAFALTLAGLVALQNQKRPLAMLLFSLALITHKGVWPVIGLVTLADFSMRREYLSKRNFTYVGILLLPLLILWISGSFYHHSITWIIDLSIEVNTTAGGGYPILDGLIGSYQKDGIVGIIKGSVVLFFLFLSITTLITSSRLKFTNYEYCIAISLAVLIMFMFSSAYTVWGPVRYSKFLVFPLVFSLYAYFKDKQFKSVELAWISILIIGLYISQLAYAGYLKILHTDNF